MRPSRRFIKTELILPETAMGKVGVIVGLVVGGTVAMTMVALFSIFLFETFRTHG
jgi:hypothetical protein